MRLVAIALTMAATLGPVAAAQAAFPGADGKIVFVTGVSNLHSVNSDGSEFVGLGSGRRPAWSPDGKKIAFDLNVCDPTCNQDIWVMNADGTGRTRVTTESSGEGDPTWSPDGQKIAFISDLNGASDIWTANIDGTGRVKVTDDLYSESDPAWSPDGSRIAFASTSPGGIMVADLGAGGYQAVSPSGDSIQPSWSPDGTKILFTRDAHLETVRPDGTGLAPVPNGAGGRAAWSPSQSKIVVGGDTMNVDGTNRSTIVNGALYPDWQPIVNGYPRPKGASPLSVSLVPAFRACVAGNRTHGPPLAFASCNPPVQGSSNVTIGTPSGDGSGAASNMTGSIRLKWIGGVPGPPDDADILIDSSITDVRCDLRNINIYSHPCGAPNSAQQNDYVGELQGSVGLRITDRWNAAAPGGGTDRATVSDFVQHFTIACNATPDPAIGGHCSVSTSANALAPGMVFDAKRMVWELGQLRVYDGGPDGNVITADASELFAVQGVFIP